jgi:hypothetical protein|tara:strand:+ start:620 stop:748 length:129 start_codon:yes stop_codon:yes gene_type:complete
MKQVVVAKLKSKHEKFDELKNFLKKKFQKLALSMVAMKHMHA